MTKDNSMLIAIAIVVAAFLIMQPPAETVTPSNGGGIDLCKVVDAEASFTGQNMYLAGTALTTEFVRVLKKNGVGVKDLGQISMNSGTISVAPNGVYKLYYGENSTTRYTAVEDYTAPCQDSTDDKVGQLCTIDTTPTITTFDEFGSVQSAGTNTQSVNANDKIDAEVRIKVSADQCYGNPSATAGNAICLKFNSSFLTKAEISGAKSISVPYAISSANSTTGYSINCFEFKKLADTESVNLPLHFEVASTWVAGRDKNLSIILNDIAFDLDADDLSEIWSFQDEDNNELGTTVYPGADYLSSG